MAKYITAETVTGKALLEYLHSTCEKTLDYCKKQGITTLEDFAVALQEISEEDNPVLKINTAVNQSGLAMKLANQPELGYTTGKYMMQHLGFEGEELSKFTRTGIENTLNPTRQQSNSKNPDNFVQLLKQQTADSNQATKETSEKKESKNELNDLLDFVEQENPQSQQSPTHSKKTQTQSSATPLGKVPKKKNLDIDSILDKAAEVGATAVNQSHEVDGMSIAGLSAETAFLAALVGKKSAEIIISTAKNLNKEKQVSQIASRIKAANERATLLTEKAEQLTESPVENTTEADTLESFKPEPKDEKIEPEQETTQSPAEILAKAILKVEEKINKTSLNESKNEPFTIDKNADFDTQLNQINKALDRIEQRLDILEQRIEALEKAREKSSIKEKQLEEDNPEPDKLPVETATLYFDGGSRGNPGIAAGAAVIITPDRQTHIISNPLEQATNNQAEYTGLIIGLEKAKELGLTHLEIKGDSQLILNQIQEENQVNSSHLQKLNKKVLSLIEQFENVEFTWIKRNENNLADQAVNDCIDETILAKQNNKSSKSTLQTPQKSSNSAIDCANTLLKTYKIGEQQAAITGETVEDGIMLGEQAILYADKNRESVTVSLERIDGEQLFSATLKDGKWQINNDALTNQDKQEIKKLDKSLEELPTESDNTSFEKQRLSVLEA